VNLIMHMHSPKKSRLDPLDRYAPVAADPLLQSGAVWHSYAGNACNQLACWERTIKPVAARVPVVVTECGHGIQWAEGLFEWIEKQDGAYALSPRKTSNAVRASHRLAWPLSSVAFLALPLPTLPPNLLTAASGTPHHYHRASACSCNDIGSISYLPWTWNTWGADADTAGGGEALVSDYTTGKPTAWGQAVKNAFAKATVGTPCS